MLKAIMENQPIGIIRLSELLNFPQHKVRYSLRILEQEGLIKPSPEGAVTTDRLEEFLDYLKASSTRCRRRSRNSARRSAKPWATGHEASSPRTPLTIARIDSVPPTPPCRRRVATPMMRLIHAPKRALPKPKRRLVSPR